MHIICFEVVNSLYSVHCVHNQNNNEECKLNRPIYYNDILCYYYMLLHLISYNLNNIAPNILNLLIMEFILLKSKSAHNRDLWYYNILKTIPI